MIEAPITGLPEGGSERGALAAALAIDDPRARDTLFEAAYDVKRRHVGTVVYLRGLVELSNVCAKDCLYCGIRRSNGAVARYTMSDEEILAAAARADRRGLGSLVLQSGELQGEEFARRIERLLRSICAETGGRLGITLSLGEQSAATYRRWFEAGAHRYLLRIETSNAALYRHLHPAGHDFEKRLRCLRDLKETGYQVGTGVMIGLPGQTPEDLADDVLFMKARDVDMVGMGPYIPHAGTPLAREAAGLDPAAALALGLRMIAVVRIVLKDVNIAATTALEALDPRGRELGLRAGANVVMPNLTPPAYRDAYRLYDGKPCRDDPYDEADAFSGTVRSFGETIGWARWGDAPHFRKRREREEAAA